MHKNIIFSLFLTTNLFGMNDGNNDLEKLFNHNAYWCYDVGAYLRDENNDSKGYCELVIKKVEEHKSLKIIKHPFGWYNNIINDILAICAEKCPDFVSRINAALPNQDAVQVPQGTRWTSDVLDKWDGSQVVKLLITEPQHIAALAKKADENLAPINSTSYY